MPGYEPARDIRHGGVWDAWPELTTRIEKGDVDQWEDAISQVKDQALDPRNYGAVDQTGVVASTAAIQACFADAAAEARPVLHPGGIIKTDVVNYQHQSIIGPGAKLAVWKGLPRKDVFHLDPAVSWAASALTDGPVLKGFRIIVDDSQDASGDFPQRGGVGNAGIATDYANGATAPNQRLFYASIDDVFIAGASGVSGGQNKSAGIYNQLVPTDCRIGKLIFARLAYGWWDDYPTSNATSVEIAGDDMAWEYLYFDLCGKALRLVNCDYGLIGQLVIHGGTHGIEFASVPSQTRQSSGQIRVKKATVETSTVSPLNISGAGHTFEDLWIGGDIVAPVVIGGNETAFDVLTLATTVPSMPQIRLTGDRNTIKRLRLQSDPTGAYGRNLIDDQGHGNRVEVNFYSQLLYTSRTKRSVNYSRDDRVIHNRDALSIFSGHVSPLFHSGNDLLVNPESFSPEPYETEGVDWMRVFDPTTEFGQILRIIGPANPTISYLNGVNAFQAGKTLPLGKVRIYVRAKLGGAGTQFVSLYTGATSLGSAQASWTTSFSTFSFDADLTGRAVGDPLSIVFGVQAGTSPLDIEWVAFRPYCADVLNSGPVGHQHVAAATPTGGVSGDVKIGNGKIWVNDSGTWKSATIA